MITGCSNDDRLHSEIESEVLSSYLTSLKDESLTKNDWDFIISLKNKSEEVNQLIEELELLTSDYAKDDELEEAIGILKIANEELLTIEKEIRKLDSENKTLQRVKIDFEKILIHAANGIHNQHSGILSGNQTKVTEGYKQTITSKEDFFEFYTFIQELASS
jgi:hypothetical protein